MQNFLLVGLGAALGAWGRWGLGLALNPLFPTLPMGTLAANLIGAWLIGLIMGFFTDFQGISPEVRLFLITGVLGGLTTFSSFAAEISNLLLRGQWLWAAAGIALHLFGSLTLAMLGILSAIWLKSL